MNWIAPQNYSVLLLKGWQSPTTRESWPFILHTAYLLSKDTVTIFPLNRDLLGPVDRIFDEIVDTLGTEYTGIRYLTEFNMKTDIDLLRETTNFISDSKQYLKLALRLNKPCIYFDSQLVKVIFIKHREKLHQRCAKDYHFDTKSIIYYDSQNRILTYGRCKDNIE